MNTISAVDFKGDEWVFMLPGVFKVNRSGMVVMWTFVKDGPVDITKWYPQVPLPVFTEWWE